MTELVQIDSVTRTRPATGKRFHFVTLGCAKNTVDSEAMQSLLLRDGLVATDSPDDADLVVVHTCGFIESAKQESIDAILKLAERKRPGQKLIAAGCLSERYPDELAAEIPELDALLGARNWGSIAGFVARLYRGAEERQPQSSLRLVEMADPGLLDLEMLPRRSQGPSAYLKISDGCDQKCSFCAIPNMKGLHRSKPSDQVYREIEQLRAQDVREVVLIGQDTTRYGHDLGIAEGLAGLLAGICRRFPDLDWIRVMYAYPRHVTQAFLDVMREERQVCAYMDMPLQHLHSETLRRMRRPHRDAEGLVAWIREQVPGIALRTTFIVGFPGETEEEFEFLCEALGRLRFDRVGVFTYSEEEGTPAHLFSDPVPPKLRATRRARVMSIARRLSLQRNRSLVGEDIDVLIEGRSNPEDGEVAIGRSYRDAPEVDGVVLVPGSHQVGALVPARVVRALEYDLVAAARLTTSVATALESGALAPR
jgi:ribosomal protein S12 methylthiotransferase